MDFNVAGLLREGVGATREYHVQETLSFADSDLVLVSPVEGTVKFTRTRRGVLVEAHLHTAVEQSCSRCLEPVVSPINLNFAEEFLQTVDLVTGLPLEVPQDDQAVLIDAHHELHMDDILRQYLLTQLPMQPLCRDDCAGLCPYCGHNLNEGPCACPSEAPDARWAALKALLHKS